MHEWTVSRPDASTQPTRSRGRRARGRRVRLRLRHAQLQRATTLGAEVSLDVRCTPPPDVVPGLFIEGRHVTELGVLRASISFEVVET